jgi:hypothetical protein
VPQELFSHGLRLLHKEQHTTQHLVKIWLTQECWASVSMVPAYLVEAPISYNEPRANAFDSPSVASGIK